ncbi:AfsA-related hotdog domain-containing protein [Streptomyces termitum]|uniref:A-factor biosynthesis protein AfsA n=1 Tax=Streptomyces termitum TaxID=67368 RepID=A0A918T8K3_9ACTN|nr:AfsA-related hotdog domain-containing protein [Streptomyces termitum]GHB06743.1 A-factor biosynthesis protein AfsA [Streptomyces termitum]
MSGDTQALVVVGDRFVGFAAQEGVVTVSQFLTELRAGAYEEGTARAVRAGQGVGDFEWQLVREQLRAHGLEHRMPPVRPGTELASRSECHKCSEPNALIADLRRVDDRLFHAALRLHNDNELLLDHQTGQHVQGMVAVEAARQMFLAVSERFFASAHPERRYYYVIESMNTDFENFLFPVDARIEYLVKTADTSDPERMSFEVEIGLFQAGRRASASRVVFSAFDERTLKPKEHRRAAQAVAHTVADTVTRAAADLREPAGV